LPQQKKEETSPLQIAALFCVLVGSAMIATTYSGILELFKGYIGGIVLLATGATLFSYDKAPEQTTQSLVAFLSFLYSIVKSLVGIVKSWLAARS
jgi:hypothetical protein